MIRLVLMFNFSRSNEYFLRKIIYYAFLILIAGCLSIVMQQKVGAIPSNVLDTLKTRSSTTNKVSPNSNLFILSNPSNNNISAHDFWHVMRIDAASGSVTKIELNAYHNGERAAKNATYRITATDVCNFINIGGSHDLTVEVNGKKVADINTNNSAAACNTFNNLSFKRPSDAGGPYILPNTPYYYNTITFRLNGPNITTGGEHRVRFRVEGPEKTRFSFTSGSEETEFGVVGGLTAPGFDASVGIPFGLSCSTNSPAFDKELRVYDPDPSFGDTYLFVMRRNRDDRADPTKWTKIPDDGESSYRYGASYHRNVTWQDGNRRWKITGAGSGGSVAKITIKELSPEYQYMFVYYNPYNPPPGDSPNGGNNPANNLLSFSLPGQSIFGQIGCRETDYRMTPHLDVQGPRTISYYANNFTARARVTKNPTSMPTDGTHPFRLTKAVFSTKPSNLANLGEVEEDTTQDPCTYIGAANRTSCTTVATGTYETDSATAYTSHANEIVPVGHYVCFIASVERPFSTGPANEWSHSNMECTVSGIKPKIQVRGGDSKANGIIETSTTDIIPTGSVFGSYGEYGVFSAGLNTRMGSGAQLANDRLTFSNIPTRGGFGALPLPIIARTNPLDYASQTLNSLDPITQAKVTIVRVSGDLTINGNLTYPSSVGSVGELRKVVIVADRIIITPNVTQIDPWLVALGPDGASGAISTCGGQNPADPTDVGVNGFLPTTNGSVLDSTMCERRITFNGPVITPHLYLYRTYDDTSGNPAETFNLRADNILSSYSGSSGITTPIATTGSVKELPPRF